MASVMDYQKCLQCGGVMFSELNCNTQEEWWMCCRCGAEGSYTLVRNRKKKVKRNRKGKVRYKLKKRFGYGVIYLMSAQKIGSYYHLG